MKTNNFIGSSARKSPSPRHIAIVVHSLALAFCLLLASHSSDAKLHSAANAKAQGSATHQLSAQQIDGLCKSRAELGALRAEMNSGKSCGKARIAGSRKVGSIATIPTLDTYEVLLKDECDSSVHYELELRNDGRTCVVMNVNEL